MCFCKPNLDSIFEKYKDVNAKDKFAQECQTWQQWSELIDLIDWKNCEEPWFCPDGKVLKQLIELETWINI